MPFPLPQADLPAYPWTGDSSSLSPGCFCQRGLGTRCWIVALLLGFTGGRLSTFLPLASSGLWHLMSWGFWIPRLAEWCWLWCSTLSILAGIEHGGAVTKAYHLSSVRQLSSSPQGFSSQPVVRRPANSLGRWERKLGGWGLEEVMLPLCSLTPRLMEIT